jgi:hypothetical protein
VVRPPGLAPQGATGRANERARTRRALSETGGEGLRRTLRICALSSDFFPSSPNYTPKKTSGARSMKDYFAPAAPGWRSTLESSALGPPLPMPKMRRLRPPLQGRSTLAPMAPLPRAIIHRLRIK